MWGTWDSACSCWALGTLLDGGLPSLLTASGRNKRMQGYGVRWEPWHLEVGETFGGAQQLGPSCRKPVRCLPCLWVSDLRLTAHPLSALLRISSPLQETYLEDCCVGQNSHCGIPDHYIGYSVGHRSDSCSRVPESLMSLKEAPGAWMGPGGFPIPLAVRFMVYEDSGFENASLGSHTRMHTETH